MEENKFNAIETLTVEQFCAKQMVEYIDVLPNPKTGKLFFTFGSKVGAVSKKGCPTNPMLSSFPVEKTKENPDGILWVLHEQGQGVKPIARFKRRED